MLTRVINYASIESATQKSLMSLQLQLTWQLLLHTTQDESKSEGRGGGDKTPREQAQEEQQMREGRHVWPTTQKTQP